MGCSQNTTTSTEYTNGLGVYCWTSGAPTFLYINGNINTGYTITRYKTITDANFSLSGTTLTITV